MKKIKIWQVPVNILVLGHFIWKVGEKNYKQKMQHKWYQWIMITKETVKS